MRPWSQQHPTLHPLVRSLSWLPRETAEAFVDSPITDKDVARVMRSAAQSLAPDQWQELAETLNQQIYDRVGFNHKADMARMRYMQGTGLGNGNGHVPYNTFELSWRQLYDTVTDFMATPEQAQAVRTAMEGLAFLGKELPMSKEQSVLNMMSIECAALRAKVMGLGFKSHNRLTDRPAELDQNGEVVSALKDLYHDQTPGKKGAMTRQVRREIRSESEENALRQLCRDSAAILNHMGLMNNDRQADQYRDAFSKNPGRAQGVGMGKRAFVASRILRDYNIGACLPAVDMDRDPETLLALRRVALAAESIVSLKPFGNSAMDAFRPGNVIDRIKQATASVAMDGAGSQQRA